MRVSAQMAKTVSPEWIVSFLFLYLYLSTVQRVGASEVLDIRLSRGRRPLQQNVDDTARDQGRILLEFRDHVKFASASKLASWVGGDGAVCGWPGVRCDSSNHVTEISLVGQQLEGTISPVLGQLQFLTVLDLSDNQFQGEIPDSLGSLQQIVTLELSNNSLSGTIPSSLHNCSSLQRLDLSHNSLSGWIPDSLGALQSFRVLSLWNNSLSGYIPVTLGNCSMLRVLVLSYNKLYGEIPSQFGKLQLLEELYLAANELSGSIPTSIGNWSRLSELHMGNNKLSGSIPVEIGQLTELQYLTLQSNNLDMGIPDSLKLCGALKQINMSQNNLTGPIPLSLGLINNLEILNLAYNNFAGEIPDALSGLFRLESLLLNNNNFTGRIPDVIGHLERLRTLNLGNNQLTGAMLSLQGPALVEVLLNNNHLTGEIPEFFPTSATILTLDVSHNLLTEEIPDSIRNMINVLSIDFSFNNLTGSIPSSLGSLKALESLDLSDNHLSGVIPFSLGELTSLAFLDISRNNLTGPIPSGWRSFSAESFAGNSRLCGFATLVDCPPDEISNEGGGSDKNRTWIYITAAIVSLLGGILALSAVVWCTCKKKSSKARLAPIMEMSNFSDGLVLTVEDVMIGTNDFNEENIIGEGSKSVVYKGVLPGGMVVAVKKLILDHNDGTASRLNHGMEVLGNLRHRNWLKVYGYLSSLDVKALVLDYAPNGSLHHQLHEDETCQLSWKLRLEIAIGIAEALVHIHHDLPRPIIHLDLKPSNVLLNENFVAKVTDLGISKLLYLDSRSGDSTASVLFGTTGYIPPEYGVSTKVSTKGDVFNYGILLLELLTRRRPTFRFEGDISLRQWVSNAADSSDGMLTVLDSSIQNELAVHEDQIQLLLRVGLLCTETSPAKRPSMKDVRDMLMQIERLSSHKPR